MNLETLTALADQNLAKSAGALKDFKAEQLNLFKEKGFSAPDFDAYKFTNLESFFSSLTGKDVKVPSITLPQSSFPTLVFTDGILSTPDLMVPGLKIKNLKDHFTDIKDLLKSNGGVSHLHHSLISEGIILEIEKNQEIKTPLRIVHTFSKTGLSAPTVFVIAHHFSKMTIIEETRGENAAYAEINETYLKAHAGAKIEHIQLDLGQEGLTHSSVFADAAKDATIRSFIFNASGKLNRKNLVLNLNEAGAHADSYALFLTEGTEHSDINTVINHYAADTTSDQMAKGILDGDSKGVFTGKIHIHPKAQRVASGQLNKNLILSKKAQVHSQPQLEIFADDVKCSHGSTTGQLSDDEVFYFMARGIPADKARTLLAHGFGLEIVQKIESLDAREFIAPIILERLAKKFALGGSV